MQSTPTAGLATCEARERSFSSGPCTNGESTGSCCTNTQCTCNRLRSLKEGEGEGEASWYENQDRELSVGDDCTTVCTCTAANDQECTLVCGECRQITVTLQYAFNGVLLTTRPLENTLCAGSNVEGCITDLETRYPEEGTIPVYFLSTTPEKPFYQRETLELAYADMPGSIVTPIVFVVLAAVALMGGACLA